MSTTAKTKWRLTEAQSAMVADNIGLVYKYVLKRFGGDHPQYDDLIQAGMLGLMRAVVKYNPTLGFKLSTYAMHWVRNYIQRWLWSDGTIYLPVHAMGGLRLRKEAEAARRVLSGSASGDDGAGIFDALGFEDDHLGTVDDSDERRRLRAAMETLGDRERAVLALRLEGRTYKAIGDSIGFFRDRVRQIEMAAIGKLKKVLGEEAEAHERQADG